jgi:hypothetical protein
MRIAELFSISLDQLLQMKSSKSEDAVSEYERLLKKGLDELKKIPTEKINIAKPDLYGKTFVEYVIEEDKVEIFQYLLSQNYKLYIDTHTSAASVLEAIIVYAVEKHNVDVFHYIKEYITLFGSLRFSSEKLEKNFYLALENWPDDLVKKRFLSETVVTERRFFKIFKRTQKNTLLSSLDYGLYIGKYHMQSFLEPYMQVHSVITIFDRIIGSFVKYGFIKGCEQIIEHLSKVDIERLKKKQEIIQNTIVYISSINRIDLLKVYLEKGIVSDYTDLVIQTSKGEQIELTKYLLDSHGKHVNYKDFGQVLIKEDKLKMLKETSQFFGKDDMDYMLGKVNPNQLDIILYLIKEKATFQVKYFNRDTAKKVNALIAHYQEGKVE